MLSRFGWPEKAKPSVDVTVNVTDGGLSPGLETQREGHRKQDVCLLVASTLLDGKSGGVNAVARAVCPATLEFALRRRSTRCGWIETMVSESHQTTANLTRNTKKTGQVCWWHRI